MNLKAIFITLFFSSFFILSPTFLYAGFNNVVSPETDSGDFQLIAFFDLRDRETFVQITNTDGTDELTSVHIQIFNVADLCNENDFFDNFTANDTHVYNIRNLTTNDGSTAGVVLPDNAYGIVVVTCQIKDLSQLTSMIGNLRILDVNGYEYRTNMQGIGIEQHSVPPESSFYTFNFDSTDGVSLSDIVGITLNNIGSEEVTAGPDIYGAFDVDIYNENEVPFSCRNVIFSCINQDSPRLEEVLADSGQASVAGFEYGINEAIPHSRQAEVLCPNNNVPSGIGVLNILGGSAEEAYIYIGLNNGNGRGSFDSAILQNFMDPVC